MAQSLLVALLTGLLQGVFEWLPISSEGAVTVALTLLGGAPGRSVSFALFLHAGTAVSASVYYREDFRELLDNAADGQSGGSEERATLRFIVIAMGVSLVVGGIAYLALEELVSAVSGGAFVAVVGGLLVATGLLQRTATVAGLGERSRPDVVDAALVGALQGLAVFPGVSRSGTTTSALLLRGHDGPGAFRLSFLLSVPAAVAAGTLAAVDDGLAGVSPTDALVAFAVAAVVGYLTIDALLRVVRRVEFWAVCVGFGLLGVVGGLAVAMAV